MKQFVFVSALLLVAWAPGAHADANSFLAYLADHHVNTGLATPYKNIQTGMQFCAALHAGQTPDQVVASIPISLGDVRGVIDAAQRELCSDTLR